MERAKKKLQLSSDVFGDDVSKDVGKELSGAEPVDLRSMIYGLQLFDPEDSKEKLSEPKFLELKAVADKVLAKRSEENVVEEKGMFGPSSFNSSGRELKVGDTDLDSSFDEASYLSWVKKFKEAAESTEQSPLELESRRVTLEGKRQRAEAARKKAEEKKLARWQTSSYHSLSVPDPVLRPVPDLISDQGCVNFVVRDCTKARDVCQSEPTMIFSCVDDSGKWGQGGMFDALARLSSRVPKAYERASEFGDLQLGDLHLIQLDDVNEEQTNERNMPQWVALGVVQSYNPRRKVPRSGIICSCSEYWYQDGLDPAVWYSIERLLRKLRPYLALRFMCITFENLQGKRMLGTLCIGVGVGDLSGIVGWGNLMLG